MSWTKRTPSKDPARHSENEFELGAPPRLATRRQPHPGLGALGLIGWRRKRKQAA